GRSHAHIQPERTRGTRSDTGRVAPTRVTIDTEHNPEFWASSAPVSPSALDRTWVGPGHWEFGEHLRVVPRILCPQRGRGTQGSSEILTEPRLARLDRAPLRETCAGQRQVRESGQWCGSGLHGRDPAVPDGRACSA